MVKLGITNSGFKRLALLVQAQAWGGDVLVVKSTRWYWPEQADDTSSTLGGMCEFSDGSKGFWLSGEIDSSGLSYSSNADLYIVKQDGSLITPAHNETDDNFEVFNTYLTAFNEYLNSAPQGTMDSTDQAEFNSVLGTSFDVYEPDPEMAEQFAGYMEGL